MDSEYLLKEIGNLKFSPEIGLKRTEGLTTRREIVFLLFFTLGLTSSRTERRCSSFLSFPAQMRFFRGPWPARISEDEAPIHPQTHPHLLRETKL
jgi:hypothetical protein